MNLFQLIYWEIERKCSAFSLSLALCRRHRHHWCCCFFSLVLIRIVRLVSIFTLINEIVCIHFAVLLMDRCIVTLIHSAFFLVYVSSMSIESELRLRENLSSSVSHQKKTQYRIKGISLRILCGVHSIHWKSLIHSRTRSEWSQKYELLNTLSFDGIRISFRFILFSLYSQPRWVPYGACINRIRKLSTWCATGDDVDDALIFHSCGFCTAWENYFIAKKTHEAHREFQFENNYNRTNLPN